MQIGGIQSGSSGLASAVSKASSAAYFDPKDTNQDGVVSAAEELAYSLNHPEAKTQASSTANSASLNSYTQAGAMNAGGKAASAMLDVYI